MSADLTDRRGAGRPGQPGAAGGAGRRAAAARAGWRPRPGRATWPKLLAIAIVLVLWQLVYLADWHGSSTNGIMKGPVQTLPVLWHDLQHAQLWGAIGTTAAQRGDRLLALALVIGSLVGALVSRIKPLRAAVGSIITGAADHAVDRLVPVRDHLLRASPRPRSCSWSSSARPRRSRTG